MSDDQRMAVNRTAHFPEGPQGHTLKDEDRFLDETVQAAHEYINDLSGKTRGVTPEEAGVDIPDPGVAPRAWMDEHIREAAQRQSTGSKGGTDIVEPFEGLSAMEEIDEYAKSLRDQFDAKRSFLRVAEWAYRRPVLAWFVPVGYLMRLIGPGDGDVFIKGWPKPQEKPLEHTWWGGHRWGAWSAEAATARRGLGEIHEITIQKRQCRVSTCLKVEVERL